MSAPLTNSPLHSVTEWRKRSNTGNGYGNSAYAKRPRYNYYYILASESSPSEDEGSESVDSIQDKETDYCKDTSDTDTKSEQSDIEVSVEYEIVDTTDGDENLFADGSSSSEDVIIAASAVAATIVNESDIEFWASDVDENDETDSATSYIEAQLLSSQVCRMCKIRNTVSCFALCSHCYQVRKTRFPPRPRRIRPKKKLVTLKNKTKPAPVTKDRLSAYLSVITARDSGQGSSQDTLGAISSQDMFGTTSSQETGGVSSHELQRLAWDQVVVPENLIQKSNTIAVSSIIDAASTSSTSTSSARALSSSSSRRESLPREPLSSFCYTACNPTVEAWVTAAKDMCIMCNEQPKNGIFVHGTSGHMCCCYKCAKKFWSKSKRCAWCNLKANNVIRGFIG